MFTREELEDMWETKPHGHFTKLMKDSKGKKRFTERFKVKTTALKTTRIELDSETEVVYAKDAKSATSSAHDMSSRVIRKRLNLDRWDASVIFTSQVMKVE